MAGSAPETTADKYPSLSRNLDLSVGRDIEALYEEAAVHLDPAPSSLDECKSVVKTCRSLMSAEAFLLQGGFVRFGRGGNAGESPPLVSFFKTGWPTYSFFYRHRDILTGYEQLIANLNNPPQAMGTLFEVGCMRLFEKNGWNFAYENTYTVSGKTYTPDIAVQKDTITLCVECKMRHPHRDQFTEKFNRRAGVLSEWSKNRSVAFAAAGMRLEVSFRERFPTAREIERFTNHLTTLFDSGSLLSSRDAEVFGCMEFIVRSQSERPHYRFRGLRAGIFQVPPKIMTKLALNDTEPCGAAFVVGAHSSHTHEQRAAARMIKEAKAQLPPNLPGVIALDFVNPALASSAIAGRLGYPEYSHVIGIVTNPLEGSGGLIRSEAMDVIYKLFQGSPLGDAILNTKIGGKPPPT